MATHVAVDAARSLLDAARRDWAQTEFPGITDLADREVNLGASGPESHLLGEWNGVWLDIATLHRPGQPPAFIGYVVALCDCCGMFAPVLSRSVSSAADFVAAFTADPPATTPQCRDCAWLHDAQETARRATSRWSRWAFKFSRGLTVEEVRARHGRDTT